MKPIPPRLTRELILMTKLSELKTLESMKTRIDITDNFEMKDSEQHTKQLMIDLLRVFCVSIAGASAIIYFAFWFYDGMKVSPLIAITQAFFILGLAVMASGVIYWGYVIRKNRRDIKAHILGVVRRLRSITNFREQ